MNLTPFAIFLAIATFGKYVAGHPVKYDQRQEGDLNVRTDVEDIVFVVVPPPDLVAASMGLVAATAADFLRKNYGAVGPEKWPMRTPPKLGFVPLEKSPYKIDLEKSGFQVKKISHHGDPNRYNFHEGKNPTKAEIKPPSLAEMEVPAKSTTEMMMEMMQSTTENKTVKKDLKQEEAKKEQTEEKIMMPEKKKEALEEKKVVEKKKETKEPTEEKRVMEKKKETKEPEEEKKTLERNKEKVTGEEQEKKEKRVPVAEQKKQEKFIEPDGVKSKTEGKTNTLRVVADNSDPDSILRLEGCGPDAYRDKEGKCVFLTPETSPK